MFTCKHTESDKAEADFLGLPWTVDVAREFLSLCKKQGAAGLTAREAHRHGRHVPLLAWMEAADYAHRRGKLRSEWGPVAQPAPVVQELRYFIPTPEPAK